MSVNYTLDLDVAFEGYDRKTEWFQPRIAMLPDEQAVLTMTKAALWGSDIFLGIYYAIWTDTGKSWQQRLNQEQDDLAVDFHRQGSLAAAGVAVDFSFVGHDIGFPSLTISLHVRSLTWASYTA